MTFNMQSYRPLFVNENIRKTSRTTNTASNHNKRVHTLTPSLHVANAVIFQPQTLTLNSTNYSTKTLNPPHSHHMILHTKPRVLAPDQTLTVSTQTLSPKPHPHENCAYFSPLESTARPLRVPQIRQPCTSQATLRSTTQPLIHHYRASCLACHEAAIQSSVLVA